MLLTELRAQGFKVLANAGALIVEPASRLTEAQRGQVRRHKPEMLRELAAEAREFREQCAREAAPLQEFREGLVLGRLCICANCAKFECSADPAEQGHCRQFDTEAWAFVPFWCSGFEATSAPAAPAYLPDLDGSRTLARALTPDPELKP